jgi:hypothetical protein
MCINKKEKMLKSKKEIEQEKVNKTKKWLFEKISKIDGFLGKSDHK